MNAQEMLLDYASRNNDRKVYTDQQFIGKAITDGVRNNESNIVRVRRESKTIILTETHQWDTLQGKAEETTEIFRVEI